MKERGTLLRLERDVIAVRSELVEPFLARIPPSPPVGAELAWCESASSRDGGYVVGSVRRLVTSWDRFLGERWRESYVNLIEGGLGRGVVPATIPEDRKPSPGHQDRCGSLGA